MSVAPMSDMSGLHVVIVPAWWPSPEQPMSGVFFADYVQAFAAAGAKVGVVFADLVRVRCLFRPTSIPWFPRIVEESLDGAAVVRIRGLHTAFRLPGVQMRRYRSWLRRGLAVYGTRYGQPDVLHAMCAIPAGWACTHLEDPLAGRVIITEHTGPFSLAMSPPAAATYVRAALAKAAGVVAVSESLREEMRAAGIDRTIDVIGNPVSEDFAPTPPPPVERDSRGRVCYKALFVGRLTESKGIRELIDAAVRIAQNAALDVEWHFAGEGPLAGEISRQFNAAGLAPKLKLHGLCERSRVAELLRESHFAVLPSHGESFSLAISEALAVGRPVVASNAPACQALVGPGDGLLVPIGDAGALANAITRLLGDYATWDWRAISARAASRFAPPVIAAQYARQFRGVKVGAAEGN